MLKLLRKIRENLLSENKFSKYLLYALGEIVLVVIGILIAISLNNKNQYTSQKIDRDTKINKLRNVIYQDSIAFSRNIENSRQIIKRIDQLIPSLKTNMTFEEYQIFIVEFQDITMNFREVEPNRTVYDELINSGNFSQIEDQVLKEKISVLYGKYEHFGTLIGTLLSTFLTTRNNLYNEGIIEYKYFNIEQSVESLKEGYEAFQFVLNDRKQRIVLENYLYMERELHENIASLYTYLVNVGMS